MSKNLKFCIIPNSILTISYYISQRAPFQRLARDVLQEMEKGLTFTPEALESLQKAAEHYITKIFETCVHTRNHAGRRTLMVRDIKLVLAILIPKWIRWSEDEIFDMS